MTKKDTRELRTETMEEYLARGGKIERIPYGVRSTGEDAPKTWGKRKPKPKTKTK